MTHVQSIPMLVYSQHSNKLFGDTVNVCARMESTGVAGFIHCSAETAALLRMSGKEALLELRDDRVMAKGKKRSAKSSGVTSERQFDGIASLRGFYWPSFQQSCPVRYVVEAWTRSRIG